jgi:hypothetical protein
MARPPQFERPDDPTRDVTAVRVAIKHLNPKDRARRTNNLNRARNAANV